MVMVMVMVMLVLGVALFWVWFVFGLRDLVFLLRPKPHGNACQDTPRVHPCRLYAGIPAVEGPVRHHRTP
jgi:hypothetical protein